MHFRAVQEATPGPRWQELFGVFWPAYEEWFLAEGDGARPSYAESVKKLGAFMPELLPMHTRLAELAGGGDRAARCLSLYRPTPYLTGCSQAVWTGDEPALIRNYDYKPSLWEGVLLASRWHERRVMAMSDCMWGVLDGINEDGLTVSLSFGGRKEVGDGFGCPLILRYILEFCGTTAEACGVLRRVPTHMAYNVTVVDAGGDFATAYLSPGRAAVIRRWPVATNHQESGDWEEYTGATYSREREQILADRLGDPLETVEGLAARFLQPPLFNTHYERGHGTLYTAIYYPTRRTMELRWPQATLRQSLADFTEHEQAMHYMST